MDQVCRVEIIWSIIELMSAISCEMHIKIHKIYSSQHIQRTTCHQPVHRRCYLWMGTSQSDSLLEKYLSHGGITMRWEGNSFCYGISYYKDRDLWHQFWFDIILAWWYLTTISLTKQNLTLVSFKRSWYFIWSFFIFCAICSYYEQWYNDTLSPQVKKLYNEIAPLQLYHLEGIA